MTEAEMNAKVRVVTEILYDTRNKSFDEGYDKGLLDAENPSKKQEAKGESQSDWALVYEYTRTMKSCLDDNDQEDLQAYIERIRELAIEHGGDSVDQLMLYLDKHKDDTNNIDSCIYIIKASNWLLERTMDIEKREKAHLISLEATKVLRKLVNTP